MTEPKKMALQTFLSHFVKDERADRRYCFIIGAGASKQSGIPTGSELVETWLKEIKELYPESDVTEWMKQHSLDEKNPAQHYPQIYDKRFEIDPKEGFFFLAKIMEGIEPSCGYSVLVQILANNSHNVAITTNFDSMLEDAMFTYTRKKPLVCGHESLTGFITPMITRPLIAKIHRDLLYAPKSSATETNDLHESWKKALSNILNMYTPVVIGYGGNDGSLMGFLEAVEKIEGGIFWCYRGKDGEPAERIKKLVSKHNGYLIPIEGFDEMMLQLNGKLGYELLDNKIIEVAAQRAQRYKDQIENIQKKENKGSETAKALKETIKKRQRDWWSVELEASAEKDKEKKEQIYLRGIQEFPKNYELLVYFSIFLQLITKDYNRAEEYYKKALEIAPNNIITIGTYASFLHEIRKDYNRAEEYYKKGLVLDPNNAINTGNYAIFLYKIRKDYDRAEEYYKKALVLDPNNSNNTGNYATFLYGIRKDYNRAEEYYKKALALDSINANHTGNYAQLMIVTGRKKEGKMLIDRAFDLKPENTDLLAELWIYRYANFYSEYGEKAYDELVKLIKSGARSISWNFKDNIELAKKEGHPFIEKLEKLDKIITENASPDIPDK